MGIAFGLASSLVWGTADFLGGVYTRRLTLAAVTVGSQIAGLLALLVAVMAGGSLGRALAMDVAASAPSCEGSAPLLDDAQVTLRQVNTQLDRVDGITSNARTVTSNVSVLTSLFTATLGGPLVRAAAFSYGLNKAIKARRAGKDTGKHSRRARRKRAA